jgi:hypothetical protein
MAVPEISFRVKERSCNHRAYGFLEMSYARLIFHPGCANPDQSGSIAQVIFAQFVVHDR